MFSFEKMSRTPRGKGRGSLPFDLLLSHFFKMRFPLVAFALLLLLLLAVAAAADTLPPPAAASSTGKDVQLPVDSTAELTGPWRIGLGGEREGDFELFLLFFECCSPTIREQREAAPFPALLESFSLRSSMRQGSVLMISLLWRLEGDELNPSSWRNCVGKDGERQPRSRKQSFFPLSST